MAPISSSSLSIGTTRRCDAPASSTRDHMRGSRSGIALVRLNVVNVHDLLGRRATRPSGCPDCGRNNGVLRQYFDIVRSGALYSATRRNASPSRSIRLPNLASQMRVAFSSMALNTGSSSPGELEMTLSTSLVAVCCSSDSVRSSVRWRSSLSSRVFSMAMTAWAAKFCTSSICLSVNGRTSWR